MILVDTNVVIWLTSDEDRLSSPAMSAVQEARVAKGGVAIANATLWEVAMLAARNRIPLPRPLGTYLDHIENTDVVLPLYGKDRCRQCSSAKTSQRTQTTG